MMWLTCACFAWYSTFQNSTLKFLFKISKSLDMWTWFVCYKLSASNVIWRCCILGHTWACAVVLCDIFKWQCVKSHSILLVLRCHALFKECILHNLIETCSFIKKNDHYYHTLTYGWACPYMDWISMSIFKGFQPITWWHIGVELDKRYLTCAYYVGRTVTSLF